MFDFIDIKSFNFLLRGVDMDSRAGYYAAIEDVKRDDINKLIHVLRGLRL